MEKTNFDELLQRYLEGKVSDEEKTKIEAWLDVRKTNNATDLELSKEDEERLFSKIISKTNNIEEVKKFLPGHKKKLPLPVIGIAASVLILIAAVFLIWNRAMLHDYIASNSEINKRILNDGSIVWLKDNSTLSFHEENGMRLCELHGNALFEVAKDPDHPFIIKCGSISLKVVGTSFSVSQTGDSVELNVLTGKVQMSNASDPQGILVAANEKAIQRSSGNPIKSSLSVEEIAETTNGTEYNMQFKDVGLGEILERVESKFNVDIELEKKSIQNCRITADFTDHSLESTLSMISEVLNIDYTIQDHKIHVTGSGCD